MSLTVVIVTYKSNHLIKNLVKSVPDNFNILIIENSLDKSLKNYLEKDFRNVEVIIPKENLGYSKAINFGVKLAKTNYVLCLVADVIFDYKSFFEIEKVCNNLKNFAIIAPTYNDESTFKNYIKDDNSKTKILNLDTNKILEVREVDGAAFVINKKKFNNEVMDKNIFMYFENTDMCLNTLRRGEKIYAILNIKFDHLGLQSSEKKYLAEITKNRNWHYCWSKFYFYQKNYSYIFALSKIFPNFLRSVFKICKFFLLKKHSHHYENALAELKGIVSGVLKKKSDYRPKLN